MTIFFCLLKTIIGYFILLFVGTNLLGLIVRGILPTYVKDMDGDLSVLTNISSGKNLVMTIAFLSITIVYFFLLYYYWNYGILTAGLILMLTRLPDLLFEMKTGEKINSSIMPKRPIDIFFSIMGWLMLPLIYFSLCYLN